MRAFKVLALSAALVSMPLIAAAEMTFNHTITGEALDLSNAEGTDTPAAKHFLETGENLYTEVPNCLAEGEQTFLASCSGCHGHVGEGKIGPGLNDDYYTYPKNKTDKGLFETMWGGARSMMGPHSDLGVDESLKVIAWIRHFYKDDPAEATWLTEEQRKTFKPYDAEHPTSVEATGDCKVPEGKS
ncbi:mxaG protein (Cytochrome c precursor) involved in Methanol dehydrogenase [Methyloligella halotolerans]|uniref:Cytochrome c-L n=1 Tax=Methyloligella halotolerans TaxID=1177755 RepID=A0A1E2RWR2_9HYPH|nr:cytochrome c(L), periplasmic [Methyloligella halotolerans]ODA66667.1 mxaG protein (Cytochrome c precursor) involved in Methanol dehydrogenase [Methyloligella halotolerans]